MEPFATVDEYRSRYPEDDTENGVLLSVLLEATDLISAELDESDIDYSDPSETFTARLARVCKSVTHRALGSMQGQDVPFGATQLSETAAQFSASVQLANPYGDLFLTAQERRSLGLGAAKALVVSPYSNAS